MAMIHLLNIWPDLRNDITISLFNFSFVMHGKLCIALLQITMQSELNRNCIYYT